MTTPEAALHSTVNKTAQAQIRTAYGKLPLRFERNQGQFDGRVKFAARGASFGLWLTGDEAVLSLQPGDDKAPAEKRAHGELDHEKPCARASEAKAAVICMKLINANRAAGVHGEEELAGRSSYFIGNDPERWRTGVSQFARVMYERVYRGIDLIYYGNGNELEYDFKVAAGANPGMIKMRFGGARRLRIDASGELVIGTAAGEVRQHKPVAYQEVAGKRREVAARYVIGKGNRISFALGRYDRRQPLVIDPVLSYSTFLGGRSSEQINAMAVDALGNSYVTGGTSSSDFPVVNPIGSFSNLSRFVFVSKLNPAGNALLYSTYISGTPNGFSSSNSGLAITLDAARNAYVTGQTTAMNFPTTPGAFQTVKAQSDRGGPLDAFALKLNADGSALVYSTYLGGGSDDIGNGIAVDAAGHAYLAGQTASPDFPTANAMQATINVQDAFVTELNATGTALIYSTFLGGGGNESGNAIAVDTAGNAYVAGGTSSSDFPAVNAIQSVYRGRGMFASGDGGNDWAAVGNAFPITTSITSIAIDPANSSVVYIGTDIHGLFKSTNGGGSWTAVNNGITDLTEFGYPGLYFPVNDLEIDPNNPAKIFAATKVYGIFRSTDGGNSWSPEGGGSITSVKIDPTNSAAIYTANPSLGLSRSTDGGNSWEQYATVIGGASRTRVLAAAPTNPTTLYVGTDLYGIWRLDGSGPAHLSFPIFTTYQALAVDPLTLATVYAGTGNGVFKSTDSGDHWAAMNNGLSSGSTTPAVVSLAIDPQSPSTIYAGTTGSLFKSTNGGGSWAALQSGLPMAYMYDIGIDAQATSHLYVGAKITDDAFVAKLNAGGLALAYSTYLGGLDSEDGFGIALDAANNVYVTGSTASTAIPGVNSARPFAGRADAFVLKLSVTGALAYFTTVGGSGFDQSTAIAVDSAGNALITGSTTGTDFPTTPGAIPVAGGSCPNCTHAFITKLNLAGTSLLYSSYLGGNELDPGAVGTLRAKGNTIAVDPAGSIYVAGQTFATNFPVTPGSFDSTYNGTSDGFVAKLNMFDICMEDETNGNLLQFSSTTGDYQFINCRKGTVYAGQGTVTVRGCKMLLMARAADHMLTAQANRCSRVASAQLTARGRAQTIRDNDMANNACGCK